MTGSFPFTAVVGQEDLQSALLLAALEPRLGGVLLRGQKGSAKTTLARGLAALLPGDAPFVELPVGASEDRVVGTVDLRAALVEGERRFVPGLLAEAHCGVLYVDEVNLLPDHLVDVLLDVAATGVNRVERDGVSQAHPSRFVLLGSMNPEEGDLRPQLLDRFGLSVDVEAPADPASRAEAVMRRMAFDADPVGFYERWANEEESLRQRLASSRPARIDQDLVTAVAALCVAVGAEGLRADLVCCRAAAALAGWEGRAVAGEEDVRRVAALALGHRRRRSPFESPGLPEHELQESLDEAFGSQGPQAIQEQGADQHQDVKTYLPGDWNGTPPHEGQSVTAGSGAPSDGAVPSGRARSLEGGPRAHQESDRSDGGRRSTSERNAAPVEAAASGAAGILMPRDGRQPRDSESWAGKGPLHDGQRGRIVGSRVPDGLPGSVALTATLDASAVRRATARSGLGHGGHGSAGFVGQVGSEPVGGELIKRSDIRETVRQQRVGTLVVLVVDTSGSMGVERRMEVAKGAVLALLVDAYQHRDRVALVTFAGDDAHVVLRPTGSVEVARARLEELPSGGRTPLAAGISLGLQLAEPAQHRAHRPLLVLVSDGRATAASGQDDPLGAALRAAEAVARKRVPAVVIDAEGGHVKLGLARDLARAMGARHVKLSDLTPTSLAEACKVGSASQGFPYPQG